MGSNKRVYAWSFRLNRDIRQRTFRGVDARTASSMHDEWSPAWSCQKDLSNYQMPRQPEAQPCQQGCILLLQKTRQRAEPQSEKAVSVLVDASRPRARTRPPRSACGQHKKPSSARIPQSRRTGHFKEATCAHFLCEIKKMPPIAVFSTCLKRRTSTSTVYILPFLGKCLVSQHHPTVESNSFSCNGQIPFPNP